MSKNPAPKGAPPDQQKQGASPLDTAKLLGSQAMPKLTALEAVRGHSVITYYLEDGAHLADEQMLHLYEHLRRIKKQSKLSLFLYSRGGATEIPAKVIQLLREYCDELAVLVPYRAHSAATHIALGADEIVMTEMSELGPVDPTRQHPLLPRVKIPSGEEVPLGVSVQDLRHVLGFIEREIGKEEMTPDAAATIYTALFDKVHPLAIGGLEQSYELAHQVSELVLASHMDPENEAEEIKAIAKRMGEDYKTHTFPIGRAEARAAGLKVVDATPAETDAMWDLYETYQGIAVSGQAKIGKDPANVSRVGHIDSQAGHTLGTQLTSTKDPSKQMVGWHSAWLVQL